MNSSKLFWGKKGKVGIGRFQNCSAGGLLKRVLNEVVDQEGDFIFQVMHETIVCSTEHVKDLSLKLVWCLNSLGVLKFGFFNTAQELVLGLS